MDMYIGIRQLSYNPNVSTYPLWQWGFGQCLPLSWSTLRGKHCQHPIAVMGVADTFRHDLESFGLLSKQHSFTSYLFGLKPVALYWKRFSVTLFSLYFFTIIFLVTAN